MNVVPRTVMSICMLHSIVSSLSLSPPPPFVCVCVCMCVSSLSLLTFNSPQFLGILVLYKQLLAYTVDYFVAHDF